jgi:hypothetical protein
MERRSRWEEQACQGSALVAAVVLESEKDVLAGRWALLWTLDVVHIDGLRYNSQLPSPAQHYHI